MDDGVIGKHHYRQTNYFGGLMLNWFNSCGGRVAQAALLAVVVLSGCQTVATQDVVKDKNPVTSEKNSKATVQPESTKFSDREFSSVIHIFGNIVNYPMPAWFSPSSEKDVFEQSKYFRDQKGPRFVFEQIPADQSFEDWREIYVVSGMLLGADVPEQKVIDLYLSGFKQGCLHRDINWYQVSNPENTIVAFCEVFDDTSGLPGTASGLGEIMVKRVFVSNGAAVSVTHEWKGNAFDYRDSKSWPVSEDAIDAMLERFKEIEVMHLGKSG